MTYVRFESSHGVEYEDCSLSCCALAPYTWSDPEKRFCKTKLHGITSQRTGILIYKITLTWIPNVMVSLLQQLRRTEFRVLITLDMFIRAVLWTGLWCHKRTHNKEVVTLCWLCFQMFLPASQWKLTFSRRGFGTNLTFRGPCIVSIFLLIYFQRDETLHSLFISGKLLYMFRVVSGAHTTVFTEAGSSNG